ncbi:reductase [Mycetocola manganoxydans]|uniref:Reductase n=1 Tax=Mycetocola manganoxydans TaxID=699879 RepID=A0A3L6ZWD5_9MICO|nr:dihydrofolate reductase family protein [Mycetocola manganoxydans]RLP71422.1 reductase [Mycetocola manganoxydans]GHD46414.1 pyrimidine reductase [Mycetocola manganoxydans]
MGRILVQQLVTLDGFAADSAGNLDFFESVTDWNEADADQLRSLDSISVMALGSTTYRMFASYWPTGQSRDELIADKLNSLDKVVFSRSLDKAPWGNHPPATIVAGDATATLRAIADDATGDVIVWGSPSLADQLFREGGVDEVWLQICPVLLGEGTRLFPDGFASQLALLESTAYDSGLLRASYALV